MEQILSGVGGDTRAVGNLSQTFPQHSHHILQQLNLQRHYGIFCDVIVRIDKYDFKAHRCILAAGCPKLQTMLYNLRPGGGDVLSLKDLSVEGFRCVIEYLYSGALELKSASIHNVIAAAQYLEARDVEKACLDYKYYKGPSNLSLTPAHISVMSEDLGYRTMSTPGGSTVGSPTSCTPIQNDHKFQSHFQLPLPLFSTPNLSVDTSYIEDYLKIIEPSGGPSGGTNPAGVLGFPSPKPFSHLENNEDTCTKIINSHSGSAEICTEPKPGKKGSTKGQATNTLPFEIQPWNLELLDEKENPEKVKEEYIFDDEAEPEQEVSDKRPKRKGKMPVRLDKLRIDTDEDEGHICYKEQEVEYKNEVEEEEFIPEKRMKKKQSRSISREEYGKLNRGQPKGSKSRSNANGNKTCLQCRRTFACPKALMKHMALHKKDKLYSCHICNMTFPRTGELTRHLHKHTKEVYQCRHCEVEYNDPKVYKKHVSEKHKVARAFYCPHPECTFTTERLSNLTRHLPIHSGQKSYLCTKCGKSFAQPDGLRHHTRCCLQIRSYLCDICGSKFNHLQSLKTHHLLHKGEKPYLCKDCGARFTDRCNYKRHRRIHDNIFPYPCEQCDKKFRHSNSLKSHIKKHIVSMPAFTSTQTASSGPDLSHVHPTLTHYVTQPHQDLTTPGSDWRIVQPHQDLSNPVYAR